MDVILMAFFIVTTLTALVAFLMDAYSAFSPWVRHHHCHCQKNDACVLGTIAGDMPDAAWQTQRSKKVMP